MLRRLRLDAKSMNGAACAGVELSCQSFINKSMALECSFALEHLTDDNDRKMGLNGIIASHGSVASMLVAFILNFEMLRAERGRQLCRYARVNWSIL